jgi:hypothetical protein
MRGNSRPRFQIPGDDAVVQAGDGAALEEEYAVRRELNAKAMSDGYASCSLEQGLFTDSKEHLPGRYVGSRETLT